MRQPHINQHKDNQPHEQQPADVAMIKPAQKAPARGNIKTAYANQMILTVFSAEHILDDVAVPKHKYRRIFRKGNRF